MENLIFNKYKSNLMIKTKIHSTGVLLKKTNKYQMYKCNKDANCFKLNYEFFFFFKRETKTMEFFLFLSPPHFLFPSFFLKRQRVGVKEEGENEKEVKKIKGKNF